MGISSKKISFLWGMPHNKKLQLITYSSIADFWTTPPARKNNPPQGSTSTYDTIFTFAYNLNKCMHIIVTNELWESVHIMGHFVVHRCNCTSVRESSCILESSSSFPFGLKFHSSVGSNSNIFRNSNISMTEIRTLALCSSKQNIEPSNIPNTEICYTQKNVFLVKFAS